MAQPTTRTTFKDYCKRKLGWPVVDLNLDDDQVEDCVDDALQFFQEYHFDATENIYLKHQITGSSVTLAGAPTGTFSDGEYVTGGTSGVRAKVHEYHSANTTLRFKEPELKFGGDGDTYYGNTTTTFATSETLTGDTSGATATTHGSTAVTIGDYDNRYIDIAEAIIGVRRIVPFSDDTDNSSMFSVKYQWALNEVHGLHGDLLSHEMKKQHLNLINDMFSGSPIFRYNRHADKLWLDITWGEDVDIDNWVIVEADRIIDPASFADIWGDMFLKQYATLLLKKQWGQNLIKYEGMQLPGGLTLNGRQLYDDAIAEIQTIEEQMQLRYELPVDHLIG